MSGIPEAISKDVRQVYSAETVTKAADTHGVPTEAVWEALAEAETDRWPIGGISDHAKASLRDVDENRLIYDDHYSGISEWQLDAGVSEEVLAAVQDVWNAVANGHERRDGRKRVEEVRPMVIVGDYREAVCREYLDDDVLNAFSDNIVESVAEEQGVPVADLWRALERECDTALDDAVSWAAEQDASGEYALDHVMDINERRAVLALTEVDTVSDYPTAVMRVYSEMAKRHDEGQMDASTGFIAPGDWRDVVQEVQNDD